MLIDPVQDLQEVLSKSFWSLCYKSCTTTKASSVILAVVYIGWASSSSRAVYGVGLRPHDCWDCGFEYRREHGCLSAVSIMCCLVEVSVTSRSLVQRSPSHCGAWLWSRNPKNEEAVMNTVENKEKNHPLGLFNYFCEKRPLSLLGLSAHLSVRPHRIHVTRLPLDGFSWNLIFEYFSKICLENSSLIKIRQE